MFKSCSILAGIAVMSMGVTAQATVIDDFSGGVIADNHPAGAGVYGTYYDVSDVAYAGAAADTLAASPAMLITDGGFTNGVYAIYEGVVPADGLYTVSADMLVNDTETSDMADYQIGVIVNGVHRGPNPSILPVADVVGSYTGLTADALDVTAIQNVVTAQFAASAGDDLLIVFSTSADNADYNVNAGFWNNATVLVDNIELNAVPEPASLALLGLGGLAVLRRR